jgi:uncharacterized membrane protein
MAKVLLVGESWFKYTMEVKGFDSFSLGGYEEGTEWIAAALREGGHEFHHLPAHLVDGAWPDPGEFDVILVSDVGANTFLLGTATFVEGVPVANRLGQLADFVRAGGGFGMIGGYLSFSGINARAHYAGTPLADVLPVSIASVDDRVEVPEGVMPTLDLADHPALAGATDLGPLLGYNRVGLRPGATLVASCGADPLIALGSFGSGRSFAYTSDCGPHWASSSYVGTPEYSALWNGLVTWAAGA